MPPGPGQFYWAPEGAIAENLEAAGFVEYEVEAIEFAMRFESVREYWQVQKDMSLRVRDATAGLSATEEETVLAGLTGRIAPYTGGGGEVTLPAKTWVAEATA